MVGADEEMSVTVVRWKFSEERLKKDLEEATEPKGKPEGTPEGEPQGKEGIDAEIKRDVLELKKEIKFKKSQGEPEVKKESPEFLTLMLEKVIDTILIEEVAILGTKMNRYRGVLAEGILAFAEGHHEDKADITRLVEAFRQGWKVYRKNEHVKATLDTFMARHVLYLPVRVDVMDIIETQVAENDGTLVEFASGVTTITLHFKYE